MEQKKTKKEIIFDAALELFSKKGYNGVGVDEIAEAVGIKGPSLYYYFKSKDVLLEEMVDYYSAIFFSVVKDGSDVKGLPGSLEELVDVSYKRLAFTIHDENTKKIRKFFVMEQFRNDKIRDFLTQFQITSVESINKMMFEHLLKIGKVKEYDPDLLSFEFSFPITIMIQLIDREPEREQEAMERIRKHMDHFVEVYSK